MNEKTGYGTPSVAVVCQVFYPDSQSTSQLFTDLFARLAERGFEIEALCGYPAMVVGGASGRKPPAREEAFGVTIRRSGGRFNFKKNLVLRALHYGLYVASTTWKLRRASRRDFVFGVTNPPFTPVWLWLASKIFRFRYELMLLDVFPDGLVALGEIKERGVLDRLWSWANRRAFARARRVLVLGRDMGDLVRERYGVPPERVRYVPHWSAYEPSKRIAPEATNLWAELGLGDSFVVQYSGNMGLWHDIETLVRGAARLRDARPDIRFVFIGDGRRADDAKALADELGCSNITWLPFQPKETLEDSLACCHLAIISQRRGLEGIAVPCKLYGILASGRGIVGMAPGDSEVARAIGEEDCGVVLEPDDDEAMAREIDRLASDRERVEAMGERAFSAYKAKYTVDIAADTFSDLWCPSKDSGRGCENA